MSSALFKSNSFLYQKLSMSLFSNEDKTVSITFSVTEFKRWKDSTIKNTFRELGWKIIVSTNWASAVCTQEVGWGKWNMLTYTSVRGSAAKLHDPLIRMLLSDRRRQKLWVYETCTCFNINRKVKIWPVKPWPGRKPIWFSRIRLSRVLYHRQGMMSTNSLVVMWCSMGYPAFFS